MKFTTLCVLFGSASVVLGLVSKDGACGGKQGQTCLNSKFGNCCSQYGYCGKTTAYCGAGCQSGFGSCNQIQTSARQTSTRLPNPTTLPSNPLPVSTNGKCGTGVTCLGSKYGSCCSQYGYCGGSNDYCGNGCQTAFGSCAGSQTPSPVDMVSKDGKCGGDKGTICTGSKYGSCCSQYSYCGSTNAYCGKGCQLPFGKCNEVPSSPFSSSTRRATSSRTSAASTTLSRSSTTSSLSSSATSSVLSSASSNSASSSSGSSSASISSAQTFSSSSTNVAEASSSASFSASFESSRLTSSSSTFTSTTSESSTIASSTSVSFTSSSSSEGPSATIAPAPVCTALPGGATCELFEGGSLSSSCPSSNGKCKNGYWARCSQAPAAGAGALLQQLGTRVQGGEGCAAACDAIDTCKGFVFSATSPVGQLCDLYSKVDATSPSFVSTFIKICDTRAAPVSSVTSSLAASSSVEASSSSSSAIEVSSTTSLASSEVPATTSSFVASSSVEASSTIASSNVPSSTSVAPSCATNFIVNGGFENEITPFQINVVSGSASLTTRTGSNTIAGPDSGARYFQIVTSQSPIVTLSQILTGLKAGTVVTCGAKYNYPGDMDAQLEAVQVVLLVDGQFCGQSQSFNTNGWENVTPSGQITIGNDNPVFQISTYLDNFFGYQLTVGLDSTRVTTLESNSLPLCL